jgi:FkbM family methyltransferase
MSFVSYAQNFEDVLLHRVFGGQETGFYVDVGAYHPVDGSVTKAFYDLGWSGINLEPGAVFDVLAAARPRDVNLRMAALDRTGEVAFVENPADPGTSRVEGDGNGKARMVPCDTLENIVGLHAGGRPVDFVKIDAEGCGALDYQLHRLAAIPPAGSRGRSHASLEQRAE